MPIYEYVCETCGSEFEVMQKFSDPELTSHECGQQSKVRRKLSLTAFHLQGGGWYASGYGNGSAGKNGDSAKPDSSAKGESSPSNGKAAASAGACAGGSCACA
jgi:putative FmdB family regulatory protein